MKLSELSEKYYFHDSSLEHSWFDKEKNELILEIELCTWMQDWYSEESDNDIEIIYLVFRNVLFSDITEFKPSNYDEILDVDLLTAENGREGIKIHIESANDFQMITIFAEDVEVKKHYPSLRKR